MTDFNKYYFENKIWFPSLWTADIPWNQISYPAFYKDNDWEIYITYRFAAQPKRAFSERMMSSWIAKYDTNSKSWKAIWAPHPVKKWYDYDQKSWAPSEPTVFAGKQWWTSYFPQLSFDKYDNMHFVGVWRSGIAWAITARPCYLFSRDQSVFRTASWKIQNLPLEPEDCSNISPVPNTQSLSSISSFTVQSDGTPHYSVLLNGKGTYIYSFQNGARKSELFPGKAVELFADDDNNIYGITNWVQILKKSPWWSWKTISQWWESCWYYNRYSLNEDKSIVYIHTHWCTTTSSVHAVRLK